MTLLPPDLEPRRLIHLIRAAVDRCSLDLTGLVVLTEAATGAYVVTPIIAAVARADRVVALTKATRHGSVAAVYRQTLELAELAGVRDRLNIQTEKSPDIVAAAAIVTNSGHVRPIDGRMTEWMHSNAVVPLMYESWELRPRDVDLIACRARGIMVAGTNECHPAVGVFPYLGIMAIKLLLEAGLGILGNHVLLLCDNSFEEHIVLALHNAGAEVSVRRTLDGLEIGNDTDVVLVAMQPTLEPLFDAATSEQLAKCSPQAVVCQFWGDVNREVLGRSGIRVCPIVEPARGHMGVLPSDIGPEPVVRLQAGGLKVGEILARARAGGASIPQAARILEESGFGEIVDPSLHYPGIRFEVQGGKVG